MKFYLLLIIFRNPQYFFKKESIVQILNLREFKVFLSNMTICKKNLKISNLNANVLQSIYIIFEISSTHFYTIIVQITNFLFGFATK